MKRILYDGWPLVYQPNHPAAIHLLTLLACHPVNFSGMVALPGPSFYALPASLDQLSIGEADRWEEIVPEKPTRLIWEQQILPGLARKSGSNLVHYTSGGAALFGNTPALLSPADFWDDKFFLRHADEGLNLAARLRLAMAHGGLSRDTTTLWPADLPLPQTNLRFLSLPPVVHPLFLAKGSTGYSREQDDLGLDDPQNCVVYLGSLATQDLRFMLNAWRWAAGSLGEVYRLVVVGRHSETRRQLDTLVREYHLEESVLGLPPVSLPDLAAIIHLCRAVFHPGRISPWGGPSRLALASGKPLIGLETRLLSAMVGPAGYLIPGKADDEQTCRELGAALISVCIEDALAEHLSNSALQRTMGWDDVNYTQALAEVYNKLVD